MDLGLAGRTALVLGGSQGLGLGVARALLEEGAEVAIASRSLEGLSAARAGLAEALRPRCRLVVADLGAPGAGETIAAAARQEVGEIDILVNNSGGPPTGLPSGVSPAEMQAQFGRMVEPLIALTLALLPGMRARRFGRILTIASSGVVQPIPHLPISNSLRSALVGFMKTLAGEVAKDGVTVNVLAPGRIATDRTRTLDAAAAVRSGRSEAEVAKESAAGIPAGRYGTVEEFGAVAAFLAGRGASYVTGSVIRVDGGAIRSI
ncbi:SDR family oxidoreductase [Prosthecomicrobium pneumaticum]|uniref:3-oxoacyl-[acyl-carrier protein] reductase n=1 Tax=Prosthecomicrobium pneumaticum TaxID=81895 RepID=A0A7W9L2I1_9HYPH|nr:SDR family oxidoreductase [Prosthecomicrobium pneumaticum]MBB5753575.1 3-oxoacyl-[acyl-carrier protein] reductase [Prosthecomicrobium pneumaticum]